jgi:hypothetical protein
MKKQIFILTILVLAASSIFAQSDSVKGAFWKPVPQTYKAKHAIEVESLFPMFFTGGYHFGVGYRYNKFRVRVSVINGGIYDAEPAGVNNSSPEYKHYYKTSPGFFFGYNVWRNLEIYSFLELHTFEIEQASTGLKNDIHSTDIGGGIS